MLKHFDLEKLRTETLLWEDIWIYNYCNYEITDKIRRDGLISKYEREVFIYDEKEFQKYLKERNSKSTQVRSVTKKSKNRSIYPLHLPIPFQANSS